MFTWNASLGSSSPQRKLVAALLLVVLGLPFVAALFAVTPKSEADLPACCRRNGKHHCAMNMNTRGELVTSHDPQFQATAEKRPFFPSSVAPAQPNPLAAPEMAAAIFGDLVSHPTAFAQTEAKRRIARDRANGKRGPPSQTTL